MGPEVDQIRDLHIGEDDFARRFVRRGKRLMWFLGAGASASSGIPTSMDMVLEFKQMLFASHKRVPVQTVADLSSPVIRSRLQDHIDSLDDLPRLGASDEYAALFEKVYPSESDRRTYIEEKVKGAKPAYGYRVLATLMHSHHVRLVWTTNFDTLIADACASIYGSTGYLTTVDLDAPEHGVQAFNDEQWPLEIKLHGDFRSRRLKNTNEELQEQDRTLRKVLIQSSERHGMVVAGYSGRDDSIMDALWQAVQQPGAFPSGLFWLYRGEGPPLNRVCQLMLEADSQGIEVGLVQIENFDETLNDLIRLFEDLDTTSLDGFGGQHNWWSPAPPLPKAKIDWPVVRLNALPVTQTPTVCRLLECDIGGTAEVRREIKKAGTKVIAVRSQAGVLAFGSDSELQSTFGTYGIRHLRYFTLKLQWREFETAEQGLVREALTSALVRQRYLKAIRRHSSDFLVPARASRSVWDPLKKLVGPIEGTVDGHEKIKWWEGLEVRLAWMEGHLWFLFEPRIVLERKTRDTILVIPDYLRRRTAERYNRKLNSLLVFWSKHLAFPQEELKALDLSEGTNAIFRLGQTTGFSRRWNA